MYAHVYSEETLQYLHGSFLHDIPQECNQSILIAQVSSKQLYIDNPSCPNKVMLKIIKVIFHNGKMSMETCATLVDSSECSTVL